MIETDVLVVGGGPVGLATGIELARRGVDVVVVERRPEGEEKHPTANHIGVRAMELLRRWGVDERIRLETFDPDHGDTRYWLTRVGGHVLHRIERPANGDGRSSPHSPVREVWAPKPMFDPVLEDQARAVGVDLRSPHDLIALDDDGDGVTAQIEGPHGREVVRARWLIGADGAGSTVRDLAGMPLAFRVELPVTLQSTYFRSVALGALLPDDGTQFAIVSIGGGMLISIDGRERWRLHIPSPGDDRRWTELEARSALIDAFGEVDVEILSVIPWRMRSSVTDRWRSGRVVLAGDSAHQVSPYGGLGMNYGLLDAEALGWRLAAVLDGWGGEALLDDYEVERRRAVEVLLGYQGVDLSTDPPTMRSRLALPPRPDGLDDEGPEGDQTRAAYGRTIAEANLEHFDNVGVDLDQRARSEGIVDDGTPEPPWYVRDYEPVARPGHRAPHVDLGGGRSSIDLWGAGFVLATPEGNDPTGLFDAARRQGVPCRVERVALDAGSAVLVRPDGVVAWRGRLAPVDDPFQVVDRLRGVQ